MTHTEIQNALDRAVAEHGVPGIVAEVRDGDETWFGTAGVADLATGAKRVPGENLHTGSSGKAFTAAAMLALEAEGRLSIDDTVERHLPGVLTNGYDGNKITIRHLLSNSSGMFATGLAPEASHRYATRSGFAEHHLDVWTKEDLLKLAVSQPPVFEPGAAFTYSNGGFYVAGAIIEKVTGNSYADEVHRTIVEPLGLSSTRVRGRHESDYAEPHPRFYSSQFLKDGVDPASVTPENWESLIEDPGMAPLDVTVFNTSLGWSAGDVVSTTGDMTRFVGALASGALLPEEQHREMWTTISTEGGYWMPYARYGLGVFEFDREITNGMVLRGVGGSLWGSYICTVSSEDGRHVVSLHTNTEWKTWDIVFDVVKAEFAKGL
ncbi:serine hydrolase domain-containing protein [Nonomuraea sp. NPDC050790]|uniref:serine hydrolase domain-containing protein n=1 Tax=Nonomuraea sp. NPDC050790 TaxID=3364371 RepID=UPI0037B057E7